MEDLFNIFGSNQAVQVATVDRHPCQSVPAAKGLLPAKSNIVGGVSSKGKKVLCDVSNKMKGLSSKPINKSDDILKKPLQISKGITENKPEHKGVKPKNKLNEMLENRKSAAHTLPSSSCDEGTEWPEVETQGPCFWDDEICSDLLWPKSDWPTLEDFSKMDKICDNENRLFGLTPSPPPVFNDDHQFCLDSPEAFHLPLDEVTVPLPWEL